jgi:RNA polymerase sigma factor (sigma-70 family)
VSSTFAVLLMPNGWEENFDVLLKWLDPDRNRAGIRYEEIRQTLIKIFSWRGFKDAEDLTDEVINRVTAKAPEVSKDFRGDPAVFFFAVAKKLAHEAYRRDQKRASLPENPSVQTVTLDDGDKAEHQCLKKCLNELPRADRELILLYYQQDEPKIPWRKALAKRFKLTPNTLRVRAHRIRSILYDCIENCMGVPPR